MHISELLHTYSSRSLRLCDQGPLIVHNTRLTKGYRAFATVTPRLWNSLPLGLRTVVSFQRQLINIWFYVLAFFLYQSVIFILQYAILKNLSYCRKKIWNQYWLIFAKSSGLILCLHVCVYSHVLLLSNSFLSVLPLSPPVVLLLRWKGSWEQPGSSFPKASQCSHFTMEQRLSQCCNASEKLNPNYNGHSLTTRN